jgi:hypothetical protein
MEHLLFGLTWAVALYAAVFGTKLYIKINRVLDQASYEYNPCIHCPISDKCKDYPDRCGGWDYATEKWSEPVSEITKN